ncbi:MAG: hypothetical protein HYY76_20705 [Acidobacteria bacterium]|nr:hypothetical protein [Acidobacteriota bacterium]
MSTDFSVAFGYVNWRFRPTSQRGEKWLKRQLYADPLVVPKAHGMMIWRAMREDGLEIAPDLDGDRERLTDFNDQFSALLVARANRLAGENQKALASLVDLRREVIASIDPRSHTLLRQIDAEIAATHGSCRTDRRSARRRGGLTWPTRLAFMGWIWRRAGDMEKVMLRCVVSIVFAVELYKFLVTVF